MIKGYLTLYLSMVLSIFLVFILLVLSGAMRNAGRVKIECVVDIGCNSVLGEFHRELLSQYDLFFIDTSYGGADGNIKNTQGHLQEYIRKNIEGNSDAPGSGWNKLTLKEASIYEVTSAAQNQGKAVYNQAIYYMEEMNKEDIFNNIRGNINAAQALDNRAGMEGWRALQEQLAAVSLPIIYDENGKAKEVALENPADIIFDMSQSDILYQTDRDITQHPSYRILEGTYHSENSNTGTFQEEKNNLFEGYLFEKCGYYGNKKEQSLLQYQIEYLIEGQASDLDNMRKIAERIFHIRFNDNLRCIENDAGRYHEAETMALSLHAVGLMPELKEAVIKSLIYACAYLESIGDVKAILSGEKIPINKNINEIQARVKDILNKNIPNIQGQSGFSYYEHLFFFVAMSESERLNVRLMNLMEMDIRITPGNGGFEIKQCIESFKVKVKMEDQFFQTYEINRKYGYY